MMTNVAAKLHNPYKEDLIHVIEMVEFFDSPVHAVDQTHT